VRAETSNANNRRFEQRGLQIGGGETVQVNITGRTDKS
jgi:hypothetical protein